MRTTTNRNKRLCLTALEDQTQWSGLCKCDLNRLAAWRNRQKCTTMHVFRVKTAIYVPIDITEGEKDDGFYFILLFCIRLIFSDGKRALRI